VDSSWTSPGILGRCYPRWKHHGFGLRVIPTAFHLYRIGSNGVIRCWQVQDGKLVYENRAERITPSASPSPVHRQSIATPDGRIYFASSGKTYVIQSGPEYKELAVNDLSDHPDYTSAAISRGRIFIKGKSYLWCIGTK
jgi:outer membrane protein assembly factor BamB